MVRKEQRQRKGDIQRMKNTTVRAFSLSANAERIIDKYAIEHEIKSKSKALDRILIEYGKTIDTCKRCKTRRGLLK